MLFISHPCIFTQSAIADEGGSLGADLLALRMIKAGHPASHIPTTQAPANSSQALVPAEEGKNGFADMLCDSGAFGKCWI